MSSNVDNRIVKMTFDNKDFQKGITKTTESLEELKQSLILKNSAKEFGEKLDGIGRALEGIQNQFSMFGTVTHRIFERLADDVFAYGKRLATVLTGIDQVNAGMSKYEQKTKAVQTIQSATKLEVKEINEYLDNLLKYTDETSYDFVDMVNNIGKFTSAGIEMGVAVESMKGIGNWAAKSGAGINEASRAMYNLSQAISQGSVKLQDWMSIENANMATKEFKETVIETAVELGVLKKTGDKVKTKKGTEITFKNFRAALSEGWFTGEVLNKTLAKYADTTKDFGAEAYRAAQKALTFSDAMQAVKDAASSGWMQTFEYLFGDLDESIELWTDFCNAIIEVIDVASSSRNRLLGRWHDLGGRTKMLEGLTNAISGLWRIIEAVGEAWHRVFPSLTVKNLLAVSDKVDEIGKKLQEIFGDTVVKKRIEKPFQVFDDSVEESRKELEMWARGKEVEELQQKLTDLGFDPGVVDGIFGPKTQKALKDYQASIEGLDVTGVFDAETANKMFPVLKKLVPELELIEEHTPSKTIEKLQNIFTGLASAVHIVWTYLKFFGGILAEVGKLLTPFLSLGFDLLELFGLWTTDLDKSIDDTDSFTAKIKKFSAALQPIRDVINNVVTAIRNFFGLGDKTDAEGKKLENASERIESFTGLFDRIKKKIIDSPYRDQIIKVWTKIKDLVDSVYKFVSSKVSTAFSYLSENVPIWFSNIAKGVGSFMSKIPGWYKKAKTFFIDLFTKVKNSEVYNNAKTGIVNFFKGIGPAVSSFVAKVPGIASKVWSFFTRLWKTIKESETAKNIWNSVKGFFISFWKTISGFFSGLGQADSKEGQATDTIKKTENVFDLISHLWDVIKTVSSSIFNGVRSFVERAGPSGLLGLIGLLFGIVTIKKFTDSISDISDAFYNLSKALKNKNKWKNIISIVALIAVVAGSIYALGSMPTGKMFQGVAGLISVIGLVGILVILMSRIAKKSPKAIAEVGTTLLEVGASIALIAASIYVLGKMDDRLFRTGILRALGIIAGMTILIVGLDVLGHKGVNVKIAAKGLIELAGCIAILGIIVKFLGSMNILVALQGVALLGIIMLELGLFLNTAKKSLRGAGSALKGLISLGLAIGIIAGVVWVLGRLNPGRALYGLVVLELILFELRRTLTSLSRKGASKVDLKGLIGLSVAITLLAGLVIILGSIPAETATRGILALVGIAIALRIASGSFSKVAKDQVTWKAIGGLLAEILVIVAAAFGLAAAMSLVSNIDWKIIASFLAGMSVLMYGVSALARASRKTTFAGVLKMAGELLAVFAVIGIVAAAVIALLQNENVVNALQNGATVLAKCIATFVEEIQAASIRAFTKNVTALNKLNNVNLEGIGSVVKAMEPIADLSRSLSSGTTFSDQIVELLGGRSPFMRFVDALPQFASAIMKAAPKLTAVSKVHTPNSVSNAIKIAKQIADLSNSLSKGSNAWESLPKWLGGGTAFEKFVATLEPFATGLANAVPSLVTLTNDYSKNNKINVDPAINAAKSIAKIANFVATGSEDGLSKERNVSFGEALSRMGAFNNFAVALPKFGEGVEKAIPSLKIANDSTFDSKPLMNIIGAIADIANKLSENTIASAFDSIGKLIKGDNYVTSFTSFTKELPIFAENVEAAIPNLKSASEAAGTEFDATSLLSQIGVIADIAATVGGSKIDDKSSETINKNSPFARFCATMPDFATSVGDFSRNIRKLYEGKDAVNAEDIITYTGNATDVATKIADFAETLKTTLSFTNANGKQVILTDLFGNNKGMGQAKSQFTRFDESMIEFGETVKTFWKTVSGVYENLETEDAKSKSVDPEKFLSYTENMVAVATKILDFGNSIKDVSTIGDKIANVFGGQQFFYWNDSLFANFNESMGEFGTTVRSFWESLDLLYNGGPSEYGDKELEGVDPEQFLSLTDNAIAVAGKIKEFGTALAGVSTGSNGESIFGDSHGMLWWYSSSDFSKFLESVGSFGKKINEFYGYVSGVDPNLLANVITPFMSALGMVANAGEPKTKDEITQMFLGLEDVLATINDLWEEGVETSPTITPVLDTTTIAEQIKGLNKMLGIEDGGTTLKTLVSAVGTTNNYNTYNYDQSVTITGNTFEVRNESDIKRLAVAIAQLNKRREAGTGNLHTDLDNATGIRG